MANPEVAEWGDRDVGDKVLIGFKNCNQNPEKIAFELGFWYNI